MAPPGKKSASERLAAHEALCRRCGICCHEKVRFGDQVVITDIPCKFLDPETNLCTAYPDRYVKQPRCSSAEDSLIANSLPGDCPYVGGRSDYLTPHLLIQHPEYEQAVNALFPGRKEGGLTRSGVMMKKYGRGRQGRP